MAPEVGHWVSIGPTRITLGLGAVGRVTSISIHPTSPSTMYVGARGSGVWKTTDGGSTWQPITDALPTLTISGIAIAPSAPSRVYIATPLGVFRSEDEGSSWFQVFSGNLHPRALDGGALLVHPTNPDQLYLTSSANGCSNTGIYRSSDGGSTWDLVLGEGCATGLVMDSANPRRLYAALSRVDPSIAGIYETTDGGTTWTKLTGCPGGALPESTADTAITLALSGSRVYASYKNSSGWRLFRTSGFSCSIGGRLERSWEVGWSPDDDTSRTLWSGIYADPADPDFVYATGTELWVSIDGGMEFKKYTPQPHVDHHGFAIHPTDPKIIYTGCDGGIYRSSNRGLSETWTFIGEGLANVEFYDIADAATKPKLVIGGTQDNGTSRYDGSSTVWKYIVGGDSEALEIDPTDANLLYEVGQAMHQVKRSTNGGEDWADIGSGLPSDCFIWDGEYPSTPINQFLVHAKMPSILLATCGSLWRGLPWETILTPSSGQVVRASIDPSVNLYYAGTNLGELHAGPAGDNWRKLFSHPMQQRVFDIEVDLDDPKTIYVAFAGADSGRVYRLRRSSATPTSVIAKDITDPAITNPVLPSGLTVKTMAVDRMSPYTIYVGTDLGVYRGRSTNKGARWSWTLYNNGLPSAVDIRDLEVHSTTGVMRAATFGRGAYEVNTDFPIGSLLAVEGKLKLLRTHNVGTKYGPPTDQIDVEVVIWLDSQPGKAFGFQLRNDQNEAAHRGMLDLLRDAFNRDRRVRVDYIREGLRNGRIVRVMDIL
jgi:photosystem II stability/assembly factor-like uncharacterized protein